MKTATRLFLMIAVILVAGCTSRPGQIVSYESRPGNLVERSTRFDGIYVGEGRAATCETPSDGIRRYDPPVVAGVIEGGRFVGNLDGCQIEMKVYTDGTVQGWTFIRTHRFIPITYTMFDGRIDGDRIVGAFEQVVQGSEASCQRGPVVMEKREPGEVSAALAQPDATVADAIEYFSPSARCRTGGIQFP